MPTLTARDLLFGEVRFPAVWLRDNCHCRDCRDPGTGQKLFGITDLAEEVVVATVSESADEVTLEFQPDGHRSVFPREWLLANAPDPSAATDHRSETAKQLWAAADLTEGLPQAVWRDYVADPRCRAACLEAVLRLGFVLLHGVPGEPGMVLRVADTFGYVRETNYGRLFDVQAKPNPNNLAFTGLTITPHTDNPYRDPVPTLQLLHCLSNAADGGETGLVDGFHAAALLRAEDAAAFQVLTRTPVPFAFRDNEAELRTCSPIIELDPTGLIRGVRFSNRHVQPLRLPYDEVTRFYAAYRAFAARAYAPNLQLNFKLAPGDCVVFDNTRILHARTAFSSVGERHLQGCYADLDSLASTLAVLGREVNT
jgi:gamma-butyrobetaine dioxygenase